MGSLLLGRCTPFFSFLINKRKINTTGSHCQLSFQNNTNKTSNFSMTEHFLKIIQPKSNWTTTNTKVSNLTSNHSAWNPEQQYKLCRLIIKHEETGHESQPSCTFTCPMSYFVQLRGALMRGGPQSESQNQSFRKLRRRPCRFQNYILYLRLSVSTHLHVICHHFILLTSLFQARILPESYQILTRILH